MTGEQLNDLEELARRATPGPWIATKMYPNNDLYVVSTSPDGPHITLADGNDGKYVAAANPATILKVLDELKKAIKERDWLIDAVASGYFKHFDGGNADAVRRIAEDEACKR